MCRPSHPCWAIASVPADSCRPTARSWLTLAPGRTPSFRGHREQLQPDLHGVSAHLSGTHRAQSCQRKIFPPRLVCHWNPLATKVQRGSHATQSLVASRKRPCPSLTRPCPSAVSLPRMRACTEHSSSLHPAPIGITLC